MSDQHVCERCSRYDRSTIEHLELLERLRVMVRNEAEKLLESSKAMGGNPYLKPADIAKIATAVITLDRLVRGQSTEKVETVERVDLSHMSDEDLEAFNELSKKAGGGK